MRFLCVVGKSGSGKSTFLSVAESLGINSFDMSSLVYEEIKKRNMSMDVASVLKFSKEIRDLYGKDIVARMLFDKIKKHGRNDFYVISGLRNVEEYEFFSHNGKALLVGITSPQKERYKRVVSRIKESNPLSFEEFIEKDKLEGLMGLDVVLERCDLYIKNNTSLPEFKDKIEKLLLFLG